MHNSHERIWQLLPSHFRMSQTTILFLAFSMFYCCVQILLQTVIILNDSAALNTIRVTVDQENITLPGFPVLGPGGDLRQCEKIPHTINTSGCGVIWESHHSYHSAPLNELAAGISTIADMILTVPMHISSLPTSTIASQQGVAFKTGSNSSPSRRCIEALGWPIFQLTNKKHEDLALIAFQVWVFGMSISALLRESTPDVLATVITHILATAWSAFTVFNTLRFELHFSETITEGTCKTLELIPDYWGKRRSLDIAILVIDGVSFCVSALLAWKLSKIFGWQTFKRIGADLAINRYYKLVLSLDIIIELSLFFIVATIALWLDQLWNGAIGKLANFMTLNRVIPIVTAIMVIPWLTTGWVSSHRELHLPMMIFLILSTIYMAGCGLMFSSKAFRWVFVEWPFFSAVSTASALLTLMAFGIGFTCQFHFGGNLQAYLAANDLNQAMSGIYLKASGMHRSGTDLSSVAPSSNDNLSCNYPLEADDDPFGRNLPILSRQPSRNSSSFSHLRDERSTSSKRWAIE